MEMRIGKDGIVYREQVYNGVPTSISTEVAFSYHSLDDESKRIFRKFCKLIAMGALEANGELSSFLTVLEDATRYRIGTR